MKTPGQKHREASTLGTSRAARSGLRPSVSRARDRETVVDRETCPPEDPGYDRANLNLRRRVESASARPAVAAPREAQPRGFRPSSSRSFSSVDRAVVSSARSARPGEPRVTPDPLFVRAVSKKRAESDGGISLSPARRPRAGDTKPLRNRLLFALRRFSRMKRPQRRRVSDPPRSPCARVRAYNSSPP